MEQHLKLFSNDGDLIQDPGQFLHLIGRLLYLTVTRQDINAYLSRFMKNSRI